MYSVFDFPAFVKVQFERKVLDVVLVLFNAVGLWLLNYIVLGEKKGWF